MHRKQKNGSTEPTILEAYKSFTNRLNSDLGSTQLKSKAGKTQSAFVAMSSCFFHSNKFFDFFH
jgi:hypothetical protein